MQQACANQEQHWEAGIAQVDLGEAYFDVNGIYCRMKYLTVSFPYGDDGFMKYESRICSFEMNGAIPQQTGMARRWCFELLLTATSAKASF